ncbi:MAG: hypothetical protein GEV04_15305 [Actinophytocola sp.]|nr:hypothetical protein [Actinophytocola sp.]
MSERKREYPVKPMNEDSDPRFTNGLMFDVSTVLYEHGYPKLSGDDHVRLMLMLFRFLYRDSD